MLMSAAWCVLAPAAAAAAAARERMGANWRARHQRLTLAACTTTLAAGAVAVASAGAHASSAHQIIGLALLGLVALHTAGEIARPRALAALAGAARRTNADDSVEGHGVVGATGVTVRVLAGADVVARTPTDPVKPPRARRVQCAWTTARAHGERALLALGLANIGLGIAAALGGGLRSPWD